MYHGYPIRMALTSLALLGLLGTRPPGPSHAGCGEIGRLYAPRLLREARSQLFVAYARDHRRRAYRVLDVLRSQGRIEDALEIHDEPPVAQETGDPRLNHLLDYIVAHCMPRPSSSL